MDEFSLINTFFKIPATLGAGVVFGIGDDAACLDLPSGYQLLVSTDTLVNEVHFLSSWDAYDIACRAVRVNVSDIAAMGAKPCWLSLALSLPELNVSWLERFSQGLHHSLKSFNVTLIGGDTTRGPLSITMTVHGLVPAGRAIQRSKAKAGDSIYISGPLGAAACALLCLEDTSIHTADKAALLLKLQHPKPRVDLADVLQSCASAAIDISDGLSADLHHICLASKLGACLNLSAIPLHPLVQKYRSKQALELALTGGDDYELCFTVPTEKEQQLLSLLTQLGLSVYKIGLMTKEIGLYALSEDGTVHTLRSDGYNHFKLSD